MARNFNPKNIIVGAAVVYVGPAGKELSRITVSASATTAQLPSNVVDGPSSSWRHLGYTMEGVTLNIEPTFNDVMVDQLLDTARLFRTQQRVSVATSLTEASLENLYVAIGARAGVNSDYQTSASTASYNELALLDESTSATRGLVGESSSAVWHLVSGSAAPAPQTQSVLHINGGALGAAPVERSVCFVGSAPTAVAESNSAIGTRAERIYTLYRAVSVEAVGVGVRRDDATVFPVNFRVMPSATQTAPDGNAAYGKIIDRIF